MAKNTITNGLAELLTCMKDKRNDFSFFDNDLFPSREELQDILDRYHAEVLYYYNESPFALRRVKDIADLFNKYPVFEESLFAGMDKYREVGSKDPLFDVMDEFHTALMFFQWGDDKQVFRFDSSFLSELSKTETVHFLPNMLDQLPFSCFYLDFSDSEQVCRDIAATGVLVRVNPYPTKCDRVWSDGTVIHNPRCLEAVRFSPSGLEGQYVTSTQDFVIPDEEVETPIVSEVVESPYITFNEGTGTYDVYDNGMFLRLVCQSLIYLSSMEPDIRESTVTKDTYRKPTPGFIKDKFSEVRAQDVGVRFGEAFRKWTNSVHVIASGKPGEGVANDAEKENTDPISYLRQRQRQRPHSRRAHWHTYWCGVGRTEKRIRWVHECFINLDLGETDMVVRPVKPEQDDTEEEMER